jgi:regulator of protease activity HflC (stomatin/prohibitin superfamily)
VARWQRFAGVVGFHLLLDSLTRPTDGPPLVGSAMAIGKFSEPLGIEVVTVEIKDVGISHGMQRALARRPEAERDRRGKVFNAEAEFRPRRRG